MMRSFNSILLSLLLARLSIGSPILPRDDDDGGEHGCKAKYVAVFSVDGLHDSDLDRWLALGPSNISELLETGYRYTDAYTTGPSDSFPGSLAQYTGANPRTTGVWYDDTYDRTYFAPSSGCKGAPGAEVLYDESIDYNNALLFSGGINPANLPQTIIGGKCTNIYPHMRTRVNTAFEVVVEAGFKTAYTDKHPAYDIMRGPSGKGLSSGYFPEIAAVGGTVEDIIAYDQYHVNAWLDWIDGKDIANAEGSIDGKAPTLFGGNFQAVSVGQKTSGYVAGSLAFTPELLKAMKFVDASLGLITQKLKSKGMLQDTLIIIASKHGQAPIDPTKYGKVDPVAVTNATGVTVDFQTSDDIALIFLHDHADTAKAAANLAAKKSALKIDDIIYGDRLVDMGFGNPLQDPAVPDIIVKPIEGIIYTTSTKKIAEHGGLSDDDRHVACFVSNPNLHKKTYNRQIYTTQVAPTILKALGINPEGLQGVKAEGTKALPGFHDLQ
ncbi:type I phosphodiesterase/nucleotide pyrophosphatase [Lepidopterella palustris CBS 459.81]|uniref:Type I phosphodiesterase/nucleotide pyrophosphatase n=1 Tax=Lepidopterella palustris CBS 459.81 TaxID=1314670 RepID=A0A8E2EAG7_9PEZI|nr:type I phosphodiesterase/nucleotide pyrophosphatase [Lepidopterella palustris CBS 459.81]